MPLTRHYLDKAKYGDYMQVPTEEMVLVYSGVFSFKYVYYMLHEWLVENGYAPPEQEFQEVYYMQRDSGAGKEIFVKWRVNKENDDYYFHNFEFDLIMHTLALSETEVMVEGKKVKLDKGECEFKILPRLRKNPKVDKAWYMQNPQLKKWLSIHYFIERRNAAFKAFYTDLNRFKDAIKEYFDIERYSTKRELLEYYKGRMEK